MARVTLGTGETITVGGTTEIFGTSGAQNVTILDGSTVTFRSGFNSGGDTIRLNGKASDFQVSFSGSNVTFQSVADGITVVIPIGVVGNTIVFDNGDTRTLSLVGGVPTLGGQAITGTPTSLPAGPGVYEVTSAGEVLEGGVIQFTVTRTDTTVAETLNATVLGNTNGGTVAAATPGSDFTVAGGVLTFAVGQATATFTVSAPIDGDVEGLEGFVVNVVKTGGQVVATTTGLILDATPEGQTFQLTAGLDRVGTGSPTDLIGSAGNTGTNGNDTIIAVTGEVSLINPNLGLTGALTPFDVINGGAGDDTMLVLDNGNLFTSAPNFSGVTVDNVENLDYRAPTRGFLGGAFNVNTAGFDGLESATFFINGSGTQTITLDDETTSTAANGITPTDVNTSANVTQLGNGALVINGGGDSLVVNAAGGDVTVGGTGASNSYDTVAINGGDDITVNDRGAQELATVTLNGFTDDATLSGTAITSVSVSNLDGGSTYRDVTINDATNVAVTLSNIDVTDLDVTLNQTGTLTVNGDGSVSGLDDITGGNNVTVNSTSGTLFFDDVTANGDNRTVTLNAAGGNLVLDDVSGSDLNFVSITGTGSVEIDTVFEDGDAIGTVITSTNSGGVTINDQLGDNTKFVGTASSGDDNLVFGATDRANSFGAGDDDVVFNADTFGNDSGTDGDNGAFDGGADYDRLFMESNDADTFTEDAQAVTNFEELVLTGQDIGKADVIDLHNIGLDTVSNVTSNVGNTAPQTEVVTINFAGLASGPSGAGNADTLTFDGDTISFTDGDDAAAQAAAFLAQYNGPNWTASAGANPGEVILTAAAPGFVDDLTAADFVFTDRTSIGVVGFEQGVGAPVTTDEGNAPVPGIVEVRTLSLDFVQVQTGQTITITEDINGGLIPAPDPVFTFTAAADLTHVGGELATFFVAAWNAPGNTLNARWTASVSGNNVVFTATSVGEQDPFTLFNNPTGNFTVGGTGLTGADTFSIDNATVAGADAIAGDDEDVTFVLDGTATGNDQVIFDGVTITFQDGDTATALANAFQTQYNAAPVRNWVVTSTPGGIVNISTVDDVNFAPNLSAADFQFVDDTNVGTPSVGVAVTNQGSTSSVTLNNFISGSTLTLNAALGTHIVNMKSDTTADVLNLVLAQVGDHGVVTADDAETVNINTAGNTTAVDTLDLLGGDLKTLVLTGANGLTLDTDSTIVSSVDASALGGKFTWDAGANAVAITVRTGAGGSDVDFTQMTIPGGNASAGTAPITFIGGSGDDLVTTGNLGTSRGTITTGGGFDDIFVGIVDGGNDFWSIKDFSAANDDLDFAAATTFLGRDQELEPTAIFQDYLDQAARGNTADGNFTAGGVRYFWYDEDGDGDIDATYVVQDNTDSEDFVDGSDTVIRLEGQITLTADNFI